MAQNEEEKDTSDNNTADKEEADVEMQYPTISSDPLKELEPGFFASLFPDLFPDGKADYKVMGHSRPGKQVTLKVRWKRKNQLIYDVYEIHTHGLLYD